MLASSGGAFIFVVVYLVFIVFEIASVWIVFAKAGRPGWAAVIPFYNLYVLCKVGGRPGWWWILYIIPIVDIVVSLVVSFGVAKHFAKGTGFAVGLWLLAFIFLPILAFGPAEYVGPAPIAV